MSNALYWVPEASNAVLTEPGAPPPNTSSCTGSGVGGGSTWNSSLSCSKGSWVMLSHGCLPLPLLPQFHLQQLDPPQDREVGFPVLSAQEAGFKPATSCCLKWG